MSEPIIDIFSHNTLEYVFECLAKFNGGNERIILRAYGGNLSKGIEIAQILQKEAGVTIQKSTIDTTCINGIDIPFIEIPLKDGNPKLTRKESNGIGNQYFQNVDYINYSTYHLLFDRYLKESGSLKILTRDQRQSPIPLLDIQEKNGVRKYTPYKVENLDKRDGIKDDEVNNALIRSGLLLPERWKKIGKKLSQYDDIILGLDTNILHRCTISKHLLPVVSLVESAEFVHTPNWILLVVPSTVMYELEEAANIRDKGLLQFKGRMGFRAIQEVMELSENIDIPGISLLIHGETNPVLDTKNILFGIRRDMHRYMWESKGGSPGSYRPLKKSSGGDMTIRYQFKKFLNQVDFHKGTFFLTADKSNSVLAQAEGLRPIYIPYSNLPPKNYAPFNPIQIPGKVEEGQKQLSINVPLGSIIYELAVSFGEIIISCGKQSPSIECDRKGADIGRWVRKQLRISRRELEVLLKNYPGKFNLEKAANLHSTITNRFESVEWLTEMGGAFRCD
ncbi:MAG: ribonuclease P subunit p25 family protein [Candidatus Aminicenantes bacterium]|jgi:DNA-binding protein